MMIPKTITPKMWGLAYRALNKALSLYGRDPDISLIDVGFRIRTSEENRIAPELAVRFHVTKKVTGEEFKNLVVSCPHRVIDAKRIGFAVDVIQASYSINSSSHGAAELSRQCAEIQDVYGGNPIENSQCHHIGTLGGFVRDRSSGDVMILSTWHVLAGAWNAQPGIPIRLPQELRRSRSHVDILAKYTRSAIGNHFDAAVASVTAHHRERNDQSGIGPVNGISVPRLGMTVIKSGAGTNVTSGIITGVSGCLVQNYYGHQWSVHSVIHIAPLQGNDALCASSDSGAWWLDQKTNCAVGMHFAGSIDPSFSLAVTMHEVLDALDVDMITERTGYVRFPKHTPREKKGDTEQPTTTIIPKRLELATLPMNTAVVQNQKSVQPAPAKIHHMPAKAKGKRIQKFDVTQIASFFNQNIRRITHAFGGLLFLLACYVTVSNFKTNMTPKPDSFHIELNHLFDLTQQISTVHRIETQRTCRINKILTIIEKYNERMTPELKLSIAREIYDMSIKYQNLDIELICATITHETALTWNPEIVSPVGAMGLMQILPTTGRYLALQEGIINYQANEILFNPNYNIRLGCRYLSYLIEAYSMDGGLAAYNGGMKRAEAWLRNGRADGILHEETALYVPSILKFYESFKRM